MSLAELQLGIICRAMPLVEARSVDRYLELRRLVNDASEESRARFESGFASFYALNAAFPTEAFRRRYFDLLWALALPIEPGTYATLLTELYQIPGSPGNHALHASFVSKLVAMHDESKPILDHNTSRFFGVVVPAEGDLDYRIALFVDHLERISRTYLLWATNPQFCTATAALCDRIPGLATCHPVRVCEFVVWAAVRHWTQVTTRQ
ncbi:MAG: hypothetical protein R6X16_17080 [Anaerolineae bacterium]